MNIIYYESIPCFLQSISKKYNSLIECILGHLYSNNLKAINVGDMPMKE